MQEEAATVPLRQTGFSAWLGQLRTQLEPERALGTPEDEAAYREVVRHTNLRNGQLLFLALALALVLWWPADWLVYRGQESVHAVFNRFRPMLAVSAFVLFLLVRLVPFCRRYAEVTLTLGGMWLAFLISDGFAQLGGPSGPWIHFLYLAVLAPVAFSGPTNARFVVTFGLEAVILGTHFGTHPAYLHDSFAASMVSQFSFASAISIGAGIINDRMRRNTFFLRSALQRQAEQLEDRVREQTAELRALTAYSESAREDERARIARELHDELGQQLTAFRYALSLAEMRFERDPESIGPNLRELRQHLQRTAETTQHIVHDLRPRVLDDLGLAAAADWLVRRTAERTGLICRFEMPSGLETLPPEVATAAYRILQESLTNVSKHAQATTAEVVLERDADSLRLSVVDDGIGLHPRESGSHPGGMGLIGMRERVRGLGGGLYIGRHPAGGTMVEARLPLTPREGT